MFAIRVPRQEYVVALRLRPTDTSFYDLFTVSAQHIVTGAGLLAEMITEGADREDVAKRMREAEHVCDENTHAIVRKVNSSFVTPFDREDIYSLASGLDDVMDDLDEVVDLILLYEVVRLPAEFLTLVEVIQRCAEITAGAMPNVRTMTGLDEYWIEINRLENEGDRLYRRAVADLFSGEHRAMDVLKWKEVIENLEEALDGLENVANIIESTVLKHT
jgi:uncharacterized protein